MKHIVNAKKLLFVFSIVLILINYLFFPKQIVVQAMALGYLVLSYYISDDKWNKHLYLNVLLFAFMDIAFILPVGEKYNIYYFHILLFIYMAIYVYSLFKSHTLIEKIKKLKENKYSLFITIFTLYIVFSFLYAKDKKSAVVTIFIYAVMILFMFMIVIENRNIKEFRKTFKFLAYLYTGFVFLGTLEIFGIRYGIRTNYMDMKIDVQSISYFKRIPIVFFYNQNNYAVFLVLGMSCLFIGYLFAKNAKEKWYYGILFIISQINLIFTTGRVSWITLFLVLFFSFFISLFYKDKKLRKNSLKFMTFALLIFFVFSFLPFSSVYYGKFNSTPMLEKLDLLKYLGGKDGDIEHNSKKISIGAEGSDSIRYTLLYDVVEGVIINKNYFGFGAGNTMRYIKEMNNTHGVYNPHSFWFEIMGDYGIPILIYLVLIYFSLLLDLLKIYDYSHGETSLRKYSLMMLISIFGFVFLAFGPSTVIAYVPFWTLIGLATAIVYNRPGSDSN